MPSGGGAVTEPEPTLISFMLDGTSYQAEAGMTWEQWVNSSYNTGGFVVNGNYITDSTRMAQVYISSGGDSIIVQKTAAIMTNTNYVLFV